jgi:hypothetical protein
VGDHQNKRAPDGADFRNGLSSRCSSRGGSPRWACRRRGARRRVAKHTKYYASTTTAQSAAFAQSLAWCFATIAAAEWACGRLSSSTSAICCSRKQHRVSAALATSVSARVTPTATCAATLTAAVTDTIPAVGDAATVPGSAPCGLGDATLTAPASFNATHADRIAATSRVALCGLPYMSKLRWSSSSV